MGSGSESVAFGRMEATAVMTPGFLRMYLHGHQKDLKERPKAFNKSSFNMLFTSLCLESR